MYTIKDVFNSRNTNYEITAMDERIYNETGWVIHQVDKRVIEYKPRFGSVYGETTVDICKDGRITAVYNFRTKDDDYDFEIVEIPECLKELVKLKYKEMINGYWSD